MPGPYGNYAASYSAAPPENSGYYNYYYTPESQYHYFPPYDAYGASREQDYPQYTWNQSTANVGNAPAQEQPGAARDQGAAAYGGYGYGYDGGGGGGGGYWGPQEYGTNIEYYRLGDIKRFPAISIVHANLPTFFLFFDAVASHFKAM